MEEIWRDIPGYEGYYQVSNMGRVRSLDRWVQNKDPRGSYLRKFPGKILKPFPDENGYQYVSLAKEGKTRRGCVHILVLRTFIGERPLNYDCNHRNGKKGDNRLENLEYCTKSENLLHSYNLLDRAHGGVAGSKHHKAKLTDNDIMNIRKLYSSGEYTQKQLGKLFGVTQTNISNIVIGIGWKHIPNPTSR